MRILIRQETEKDFDTVYSLITDAFKNAEHTDNDEQNLVTRLRKSGAFIPELSLVAVVNEEITGHIMFSKVKIGKHTALALAPVSILPKMQKQGIGAELIKTGHEVAKKLGYSVSVVLGYPTYYTRFGYVPAINYGIKAPFDIPDDYFMAVKLRDGDSIEHIYGTVEYAKEFFVK